MSSSFQLCVSWKGLSGIENFHLKRWMKTCLKYTLGSSNVLQVLRLCMVPDVSDTARIFWDVAHLFCFSGIFLLFLALRRKVVSNYGSHLIWPESWQAVPSTDWCDVLGCFLCLSEDTGGQHCSAPGSLRSKGCCLPKHLSAQSRSFSLHSQEAGGTNAKVSSLLIQAGLKWAVQIS